MLKYSLIGVLISLGLININSQPCDFPAPPALNCEDAEIICNIIDLDGYCTTLPDYNNPTAPDPVCSLLGGGVPNNTIWFGFVASAYFMSITLDITNCIGMPGIQTGIFSGSCDDLHPLVCSGNCSIDFFNMQSFDFIPGEVYWLLMDGCAGSVCDITINVIAGGEVKLGTLGPIAGPKKPCLGDAYIYSVDKVVGATEYHWTLNGNPLGDPPSETNETYLGFDLPGVYQLCVDVANRCNDVGLPPLQKCIDITVSPNPEKDIGIIYKCYPDCITIEDVYGNGNIFCDNTESEEVVLQSWKGCDSTVTFTLRLIDLNVNIDHPSDIGCLVNQALLDGSHTLDKLGNYDHLNIKWEAFNGGIIKGPLNKLVTSTEKGGKYCLTVEAVAPGGSPICIDSACVIVKEDPYSPTASIAGDTLSCSKDTIILTGITGNPASTYQWIGPGGVIYTDKIIQVAEQGVYNLTITAPNQCKANASFNVITLQNDPGRPVANASVLNNLTCDSLQVVLYGSGGLNLTDFKYSWSFKSSEFATVKNTTTNKPGEYLLKVSNKHCIDSVVLHVVQDTVRPDVSALNDTTDCLTGKATLKGFSNVNAAEFSWYTIPAGSLPFETNPEATVPAGLYNLVVKNPLNGCLSDITLEAVADEDTPDLVLTKDNDLNCNFSVSTLTASSSTGGLSYTWSSGTPTASPVIVTTSIPGTYIITATNLVNQCKAVSNIIVDLDTIKPIISAISDTINCYDPVAHIDGVSDVINNTTITWTDASGTNTANSLDFATNISQTYTLLVINNTNGCSEALKLQVPENVKIPDINAVGAKIDCENLIVTATGNSNTSNVNFNWAGPGYSANTKNATGITDSGKYTFTVSDVSNGCHASQDIIINKDVTVPDVVATGGKLTCANNSKVTLIATSSVTGATFLWSGPGGFSSFLQNPIGSKAGDYTIKVTNPVNHCTNMAFATLVSDTIAPDLSVNNAVIDCVNADQVLKAGSSTSGVNYLWNGPGISNISTPSINVDMPGDYTIEVTAPNGCKATDISKVSFKGILPVAIINSLGELNCISKIVHVDSKGSSSGSEYLNSWSGPMTIDQSAVEFDALVPGTYSLTVTNVQTGCKKDTSVVISDNKNAPNGIVTSIKNPNCFSSSDGNIIIDDISGGIPPYLYSINAKGYNSQSHFSTLKEGTYKISIKDDLGCIYDTLVTLSNPKKLIIDAGKDSIISWGTSITFYADTLNAANVNSITWTPKLDSSCFNCLNPTVKLFNSQLFNITVTDMNGCTSSDKVLILVKKERPVFIPNTFSPNGDGINDIFFINAGEGIEEVSYFQIYDRWGEKVFDKESFQPNDPDYGWNGLHRGKKVNSGVFIYWAMVKFKDGESILYKGDVTVQR